MITYIIEIEYQLSFSPYLFLIIGDAGLYLFYTMIGDVAIVVGGSSNFTGRTAEPYLIGSVFIRFFPESLRSQKTALFNYLDHLSMGILKQSGWKISMRTGLSG